METVKKPLDLINNEIHIIGSHFSGIYLSKFSERIAQ